MALSSIFFGHLLVDWFDHVSFSPYVKYTPLLDTLTEIWPSPRILDPMTFFPRSVVPLCEAALAPRPEREQATPWEVTPSLCSTSRSLPQPASEAPRRAVAWGGGVRDGCGCASSC